MFSSNDDPVSIRRGLAAGSDLYLTKPFTREALLAMMRELDTGQPVPTQVPLELDAPDEAQRTPQPGSEVAVDAELLEDAAPHKADAGHAGRGQNSR